MEQMYYDLIELAIKVFTPVILLLATILTAKLLKKFGIEEKATLNALIISYVKQGINYADAWAKKQVTKPYGEEKMDIAIKHILENINDSKLPNIASEKLKELIEAQLSKDGEIEDPHK